MSSRKHLTYGIAIAIIVAVGMLAWAFIGGLAMFSPGALNSQAKNVTLGGVTSHAQLERDCGACHPAPWSTQTAADRCVGCHTDIGSQIQSGTGFHSGLFKTPALRTCRGCHPEHQGAGAALTAFDGIGFDHSRSPFKLTGKHASLACGRCHADLKSIQAMQSTPQTCYGCHAAKDTHKGGFGQACDQCHSTDTWAGARFDHTIFPVTHGNREQTPTCKTCHPTDTSSYTCLGCHAHTPANIASRHESRSLAQLTDCVRCHPGGRRGGD